VIIDKTDEDVIDEADNNNNTPYDLKYNTDILNLIN